MSLLALVEGQVWSSGSQKGGLAAWQEREALTYIEDRLAEPITLEVFAELVGLSTYHFCRAFKRSIPPHRYHTRRRIERAKELLGKPSLSITQVGLFVGFSTPSAFATTFRKVTGLTPSAYRRSCHRVL
jgi:AraC family transcriptional regulator